MLGAQAALREVAQQLEARVAQRTAQLAAALHHTAQERALYADVLDQSPAAVCLLRCPEHCFAYVNARYQALYPDRPLWGRRLAEAVPEAAAQGFVALLDRVFATGEAHHGQEVPFADVGPRGPRERFFDFTFQAARVGQQVVGIDVFAFEVTSQVRVRQQVAVAIFRGPRHVIELANPAVCEFWGRTSAQVLGQPLFEAMPELVGQGFEELLDGVLATGEANEGLDSFVYAASHDLKLPLINLTGLFEELRRGVTFHDPAEERLLVPLIGDALRQLGTTLDGLAALGQAQQAAGTPPETVLLAALVADVLLTLEPQMRAARARVTTDFSVRPTLTYSRAGLHTVLLNLLSNAFKYADPTRPVRVHLSLWLDAGESVLLVKDNGLGFDAAGHGPELFQLFRRFHTHTEGTGVGLYLVNRIVHSHGGRLEVDSAVGAGTTFRVYLGRAV